MIRLGWSFSHCVPELPLAWVQSSAKIFCHLTIIRKFRSLNDIVFIEFKFCYSTQLYNSITILKTAESEENSIPEHTVTEDLWWAHNQVCDYKKWVKLWISCDLPEGINEKGQYDYHMPYDANYIWKHINNLMVILEFLQCKAKGWSTRPQKVDFLELLF